MDVVWERERKEKMGGWNLELGGSGRMEGCGISQARPENQPENQKILSRPRIGETRRETPVDWTTGKHPH